MKNSKAVLVPVDINGNEITPQIPVGTRMRGSEGGANYVVQLDTPEVLVGVRTLGDGTARVRLVPKEVPVTEFIKRAAEAAGLEGKQDNTHFSTVTEDDEEVLDLLNRFFNR